MGPNTFPESAAKQMAGFEVATGGRFSGGRRGLRAPNAIVALLAVNFLPFRRMIAAFRTARKSWAVGYNCDPIRNAARATSPRNSADTCLTALAARSSARQVRNLPND